MLLNKYVRVLLNKGTIQNYTFVYGAHLGLTSASFDIVSLNPFRFGSEYYDSELDLVYYNFRHYSPVLGRFLSRDPIEEQGGLNLYAFVGNRTTFQNDSLGLKWEVSRCVKMSVSVAGGFYVVVGGRADLSGVLEFCDCCNSSTGEHEENGQITGGITASLSVGVGFGVTLSALHYGFDISFTGPQLTYKLSGNYGKRCGYPEQSLSVKSRVFADLKIGTTFVVGAISGGGTWYSEAELILSTRRIELLGKWGYEAFVSAQINFPFVSLGYDWILDSDSDYSKLIDLKF